MLLIVSFLLSYQIPLLNANHLYYKYMRESDKQLGCSEATSGLVKAVANNHFRSNLTVVVFDGVYKVDINFKYILDDILKGLLHTTIMFGENKKAFEIPRENEQPSWIVFSSQMDAKKGRTLIISHNSPFQIKEWLTTPFATKYMDIIAISDPGLLRDRGGPKDCDVGIYTHSFNGENYGSATARIMTSWRKNKFTREVNLFPNKYKYGCKGVHMVVAVDSQPPFAYKRSDVGEVGEIRWDGVEVRLLYHLADILNFTLEFKESKSPEKQKGLIEDLQLGQADIGIGKQIVTSELYKKISITYPHSIDCAAFMSLTSTALPKYRAIMGPFLWDVWVVLTIAYLLAVIPFSFSAWRTLKPLIDHPSELENMFWYVFGTFTNLFTFSNKNSWTASENFSTKIFIGTYWVFTIIITACYTGSIIAFITLPIYPDVVDTLHQLLHKNYKVVTLDTGGWWELLTSAQDDEASGLAGTAETVSNVYEGLLAVTTSVNEDKPVALLGSTELLTYIVKTNFTSSSIGKRKMFHVSEQCFVPQIISITLPKDSLYTDAFNYALLSTSESGLLAKFIKDVEWTIYKSADRTLFEGGLKLDAIERQLTLDDTQGMFLLLGCGFALAFGAYAFEVGTWIKNRVGRNLTAVAKERFLDVSRRLSHAITAPTTSHIRQHYPLYFRNDCRRRSSLFGSAVIKAPAFSDINLKVTSDEKPIRLLSF